MPSLKWLTSARVLRKWLLNEFPRLARPNRALPGLPPLNLPDIDHHTCGVGQRRRARSLASIVREGPPTPIITTSFLSVSTTEGSTSREALAAGGKAVRESGM